LPKLNPGHGVIVAAIVSIFGLILFLVAMTGQPGTSMGANVAVTPTRPAPVAVITSPSLPLPTIQVKAWDGRGRFTILFMGLDARPSESLRNARGDTLILVSIDPETKTATMLSIPRDLYVPIPGESEMQKVNAAYVVGELKRPGSGPQTVMQTLQYNLGIKIHAFVAVNFQAVITFVDAIGGVDIDVPYRIEDYQYPDMNFGYEPLLIPAGRQHFDGQLALKYARTRHQTTDFDRTQRQQQLLMAIRDKVTRIEVFSDLVRRAPGLITEVSDGILTDLTPEQAVSLAGLLREIPLDKFKRGTIDGDYLRPVPNTTEQALTLRREKIAELMTKLFGANYAK
jgi:polyisoprenyl-teichoic acid--peptidoglycan teichoic acid transferase